MLPETRLARLELCPARTLGQPNLITGSKISLMIFEAAGTDPAAFHGPAVN